jgi:hypothetical protein
LDFWDEFERALTGANSKKTRRSVDLVFDYIGDLGVFEDADEAVLWLSMGLAE